MKIEYRASGGVGGWIILADDSVVALAARIAGYQPEFSMSPAVEPGFGGGVAVFDNGNGTWTLGFQVERIHGTPDAALDYIVTHPAAFAALGNLDLKITNGTKTTYMAACAVTKFSPEPASDQHTLCRYAFVGGSYTNAVLP